MVNHPTSEMTLPPAEPAAMTRSGFQFQDLAICRNSLKDNQLPPPPRIFSYYPQLATVSLRSIEGRMIAALMRGALFAPGW